MDKKPRYSRITDILELIILMQSKVRGVTLLDIQNHFGVSRRTAERLRDSITNILPDVGEIDTTGKEKRWGFVSGHMKSVIFFTPDEIAMLESVKDGISYEDKKKSLNGVINKLRAISGKQMTKIDDTIELLMRTEGVAVSQKPKYKVDVELFDTIRQAIREQKRVKVKHNGKEKHLAPYGIIYGSNVYLVGIEGDYTEPYVYAMHKLSDVKLTRENFEKGDFDIKEYANRSFGVFQNEAYKVELMFRPEVAEDVMNYSFHPTQKVKKNDDGSVTVKFRASGDLEILWHIFRWGDNVKIVSPKNLKTAYIKMLENVLQTQKGY